MARSAGIVLILVFNFFLLVDSAKAPTPVEISKFYAQKVIAKFTSHESLTVPQLEKLLIKLESQIERKENQSCLNGLNFLQTIDPENVTESFAVDVDHVISLCPILLHNLATGNSLMNDNPCLTEEKVTKVESRASVWFYSTIAIILISLCGLAGVAVIPIVDKNFYFYVLQFFMALAVGTLTGDALLHLLPHAMRTTDNLPKEEFLKMMMQRGAAVLSGILAFSIFERLLTVFTKLKNRDENEADGASEKLNNHGHSHAKVDTKSGSMSSIVWMVILGDGLHNFTDGMTIGAAFSNNIAGGFSTTVAVFCHELPHEMGDFAVLLKAGMSAKQAIFYNILSSVLSFFGMCVGILIGNAEETTQWVFAVAAGLFIYIALVDMVSVD
jgi:zinc transporter ZupT